MAKFCRLILTTVCLLHCQVLAVQWKSSNHIVLKDDVNGRRREVATSEVSPSLDKESLPLNNGLAAHLSNLRGVTARSLKSHEEPNRKSWQHLTYEHQYEKKKTSTKASTDDGKRSIMKLSFVGKSNLRDGEKRVKRSGGKKKKSKGWKDIEDVKKKNDSDADKKKHSMVKAFNPPESTIQDLSRNVAEDKSLNADVGSGSNDSSSSPLVYILPVILGFLIISLIITLLMYRKLKNKARGGSSVHEAELPDVMMSDLSQKAESQSGHKRPEEAVELVDLVEYHPAKERELMSGHVSEWDREAIEPLMLYRNRSHLEEADLDIPEIKYRRHHRRSSREEVRTSKTTNIELTRQDSPNSNFGQEEERGLFEKIYISLPPRPPSDNYIEATSTSTSVSSTKSVTSPKLEWLTKYTAVDAKNEASNYQSEISTQTDSSVEPLFNKTVFRTPWQFGGTFTKKGGVLQPENSDVFLTLGTNAVRSKDYVDIYGAVFTETQEICEKFGIPQNEILVTPVVEYHTPGNYQFSRHVRINLPHALPEDSNLKSLKVYGFRVDEQGQVSTQLVSVRKRGNTCWDQDSFWEYVNKDQTIQIWTLHFSGYFCTSCESKSSMTSICARVFGSHVQIKSQRREIRIILYIWDRRLNIRDFLQRIIEQESDMDRQLLADQQIPLPENATSDSHVIMKMDTLGDEEDRTCWRHVMRPNTGRPLFRPLQVRKLFQIIQCCQQTDPLRVEWAMENMPNTVPSSVFQCCIDMLHVPESTTNFEQALEDADEDYMRTFYVRDLTLSGGHAQRQCSCEELQTAESKDLYFNLALAELNQQETESLCEALGLAKKDIGNLCKKFPSEDKVKYGLIEECCRRIGQEHFSHRLPEVLKQMGFTHVLDVLEKRQQFSSGQHGLSQTNMKMINNLDKTTHSPRNVSESLESNTEPKTISSYASGGNFNSKQYTGFQKQISEQSNEVFMYDDNPSNYCASYPVNVNVRYPQDVNGNHNQNFSRPYSQSQRYSKERKSVDRQLSSQSFSHKSDQYPLHPSENQHVRREIYPAVQKSSSSGSDSALKGNSINSSDVVMSSLDHASMEAQADSKEFQHRDEKEEFEEFEEETFKKETVQAEQREIRRGFPDIEEEARSSRHGPVALPHYANYDSRLQTNSNYCNGNSSLENDRSDQKKSQQSTRVNDLDETCCKETFETIV